MIFFHNRAALYTAIQPQHHNNQFNFPEMCTAHVYLQSYVVCTCVCVRTCLKWIMISLDSSMSLNIPSSLLVKAAPHSVEQPEIQQTSG